MYCWLKGFYCKMNKYGITLSHHIKTNGSAHHPTKYTYILLISTILIYISTSFSSYTYTCFCDHKISIAALIYKSIKWSTFNVGLVPGKNFRMIAPIIFPVGVSTSGKKFNRLLLIFSSILLQIVPNFMEMWSLGSIEFGAQEHSSCTHLLFDVKKKKVSD